MTGKEAPALAMERERVSLEGCLVVAKGQIDLYSAPLFKSTLVDAIDDGASYLVVDLSGVDFMDSTGLGVLVGVSKKLRTLGGRLAILSPDETIRRVFEIAGLTNWFSIYDSRSELAPSL